MNGNIIAAKSSQEFHRHMSGGKGVGIGGDLESLAANACYSSTTLAQLCGISLRQLQRQFHARHGETLGQWLNRLRLKHAYSQLIEGNTVKETTFSLGYKQVSHFSRHFKKFYGINPSTVCTSMRADRSRPTVDCGATQLIFF